MSVIPARWHASRVYCRSKAKSRFVSASRASHTRLGRIAWPNPDEGTTAKVLEALPLHRQQPGRPSFAQFDNDLRFLGPIRCPDTLGQVVSLCLQLQVAPIFAPPAEHGLQNLVESFNALWQTKVWHRFEHQHLTEVSHRSEQFVTALQQRWAARNEKAPLRQPFPQNWQFDRR